eukprot:RCo029474
MRVYDATTGKEIALPHGLSAQLTMEELRGLVCTALRVEELHAPMFSRDGLPLRSDDALSSYDQIFVVPLHSSSEVQEQPKPPATVPVNFASSSSSSSSALLKGRLEAQTKYAEAFHQVAIVKISEMQGGIQATQVQLDLERCLVSNLQREIKPVKDFHAQFLCKEKEYADLLKGFPSDCQRLKDAKLYPNTSTDPTLTTLWDYGGTKLEGLVQRCRHNLERPSRVMEEVGEELKRLPRQVEEGGKCVSAENILKEAQKLADDQKAYFELSRANFQSAFNSVDGSVDRPTYEPVLEKFESSSLPQIRLNEQRLVEMAVFVRKRQKDNGAVLCELLLHYEDYKAKARELRKRLSGYSDNFRLLDTEFSRLRVGHHLPEAYRWSLLEVVRRRTVTRAILNRILQFWQTMVRVYRGEARQRQMFLQQYGPYMVKDLISGLSEALPCKDALYALRSAQASFRSELPPIHWASQVREHFYPVRFNDWEHELGPPLDALLPDVLD